MGFFMPDKDTDLLEEHRKAISRLRRAFGRDDGRLNEVLYDEDGRIEGTYLVLPAPTE